MREIIAVLASVLVVVLALNTGLIRSGMEYEVLKQSNENLQAANDRLSEAIKRGSTGNLQLLRVLEQSGNTRSVMGDRLRKAGEDLARSWKREIQQGDAEWKVQGATAVLRVNQDVWWEGSAGSLKPSASPLLLALSAILNRFPEMEMEIAGHSDAPAGPGEESTFRRNAYLRAQEVADFLIQRGNVDPLQLVVSSFGSARPRVMNDSEQNRRQNRRIELTLVPLAEQTLNQAREYSEKAGSASPAASPPKVKKIKENGGAVSVQPLGEEGLKNMNDNDFGAGYAKPEN